MVQFFNNESGMTRIQSNEWPAVLKAMAEAVNDCNRCRCSA